MSFEVWIADGVDGTLKMCIRIKIGHNNVITRKSAIHVCVIATHLERVINEIVIV